MDDFIAAVPREQIMDALRAGLYQFGDMKLLANRTGFSVACLQNIRSGRTVWPRPLTMFTLLHVLGYDLVLVRRNH